MAKKNGTLLAMLAGAALAGGFLYLKKLNEQPEAEPVSEKPGPDEAEQAAAEYGWKATFTDENGKETTADEATAELKEEAVKVLSEFKETAKAAGTEILAGLKKAYEDMKVAVNDAQQAAAERRAQEAEEAPADPVESAQEAVDDALDKVRSAMDKAEKTAEEVLEGVEEKVEDVKDAVEEKAEDAAEAFEEIKTEATERVEELKD